MALLFNYGLNRTLPPHCRCPRQVCQEAAELKQRKEARLQAAGGDYHVAVEPPKEQRMA